MGGSFVSSGNLASVFARYHFRPHFHQFAGFRLVAPEKNEEAETFMTSCTGEVFDTTMTWYTCAFNRIAMFIVRSLSRRQKRSDAQEGRHWSSRDDCASYLVVRQWTAYKPDCCDNTTLYANARDHHARGILTSRVFCLQTRLHRSWGTTRSALPPRVRCRRVERLRGKRRQSRA